MLRRFAAAVPFACLLLLPGVLTAQAMRYVDGRSGVDDPAHGGSAAMPWRTIGYALAQCQSPATGAVVVQVRGDQSYGPTTNGETFPLAMPGHVQLRGEPGPAGARPSLSLPAGATGITVAASTSVQGRLLSGLDVQGGAVALRCGAAPASSHRIELADCTFGNQATAGVHVLPAGGQEELALRDCLLHGNGNGNVLQVGIRYAQGSARLTLERCRFAHILGIELGGIGTSATSGLLRLDAADCTWEQARGISGFGDIGTYFNPSTWSFRDCRFTGAVAFDDFGINGHRDIALERCAFAACPVAIACGCTMYHGSTRWTIDHCAFDGCGTAISCSQVVNSAYGFLLRDTVVRGFHTAFGLTTGNENGCLDFALERCRVIDGVHGIHHSGLASAGEVRVDTTILARCSGTAVHYTGFHGPGAQSWQRFLVSDSTIADCQTGIEMISSAPFNWLGRIAFTGNGTDFVPPPPYTPPGAPPGYSYVPSCNACLTDGPPLPGVGNVAVADAGVLRPQYKLLPHSPCIDAGGGASAGTTDYEGDPRALAGTPTGTPLVDIGADEYAPYGSLRSFGFPGRTPTSLRPAIATNSTNARLGLPYDIRLAGAAPAGGLTAPGFAFLATGLRDLATPLPFDLAAFGVPDSYLWLDPQDVAMPLAVSASGAAATTFLLPNIPGLAGLPIAHQWLVALPPPHGLVTTDALRVTFGP